LLVWAEAEPSLGRGKARLDERRKPSQEQSLVKLAEAGKERNGTPIPKRTWVTMLLQQHHKCSWVGTTPQQNRRLKKARSALSH
jgi:hypothetical protein